MENNVKLWITIRTTMDNSGQLWTTLNNYGQLWTTMDNYEQLCTTMNNLVKFGNCEQLYGRL